MENTKNFNAPVISLFATAARPDYWLKFYRSLGQNQLNFEVVFVGPNAPSFSLPDNFKFIQSATKPVQCVEIAARNCSGEFIAQVADDLEFKTDSPLDKLYADYCAYKRNDIIISCQFMRNGQLQPMTDQLLFPYDKNSPAMPLAGLIKRSFYQELGGMDKNFIAIHSELDLAMRVFALGGKVEFSQVCIEEDKNKRQGSDLCHEFWRHDRKLMERLWSKRISLFSPKRQAHFKRIKPFEPFRDKDICEITQGPKGRW